MEIIKNPPFFYRGGKPLLRKDIFKILAFINAKKINCVLLTNGLCLNDKIILKLKALNLKIQIGLDSLDPSLHDYLRGRKGSFIKSFDSLKKAIDEGLEVGVATIATKLNFKEIPNLINKLISIGVSWVCIPRFILCGRGNLNQSLSLSVKERVELIRKIVKNKYFLKNKIFFDDSVKILFTKENLLPYDCTAGIIKLLIDSSGNVMHCPMFRRVIGSIRKNSLKEIWNKSNVLTTLRNRKNFKGECRNCIYPNVCGGCRAIAYYMENDYLASDRLCPKIKNNFSIAN